MKKENDILKTPSPSRYKLPFDLVDQKGRPQHSIVERLSDFL
jgi:hypothetical protein